MRKIQNNVRGWLLRKNYINLREATKTLQGAWRVRRRSHSGHTGGLLHTSTAELGLRGERADSLVGCAGVEHTVLPVTAGINDMYGSMVGTGALTSSIRTTRTLPLSNTHSTPLHTIREQQTYSSCPINAGSVMNDYSLSILPIESYVNSTSSSTSASPIFDKTTGFISSDSEPSNVAGITNDVQHTDVTSHTAKTLPVYTTTNPTTISGVGYEDITIVDGSNKIARQTYYSISHSSREIHAAETLQSATRSMLARRRTFLQAKKQAMASLVIQKSLLQWWSQKYAQDEEKRKKTQEMLMNQRERYYQQQQEASVENVGEDGRKRKNR